MVSLHKPALTGGFGEGMVVLKLFYFEAKSLSGPDLICSFYPCSLLISSSGISWNGLDFVFPASPLSLWFLDSTVRGKCYSGPGRLCFSLGKRSFFSSIGDGQPLLPPTSDSWWSLLWGMSGGSLRCMWDGESVIMTEFSLCSSKYL